MQSAKHLRDDGDDNSELRPPLKAEISSSIRHKTELLQYPLLKSRNRKAGSTASNYYIHLMIEITMKSVISRNNQIVKQLSANFLRNSLRIKTKDYSSFHRGSNYRSRNPAVPLLQFSYFDNEHISHDLTLSSCGKKQVLFVKCWCYLHTLNCGCVCLRHSSL